MSGTDVASSHELNAAKARADLSRGKGDEDMKELGTLSNEYGLTEQCLDDLALAVEDLERPVLAER